MSDPFFEFDQSSATNLETSFNEEEDDTDYDALNSETFGEDVPASNWEEVHEKLTSQLENTHFEEVNNELGERIASYILDDEVEDSIPAKTSTITSGALQSSSWWKETNAYKPDATSENTTKPILDTWWNVQKTNIIHLTPNDGNTLISHPKPAKILTVAELEQNMRKEVESKNGGNSTLPSTKISRDNNHAPMNFVRDQLSNGHYSKHRHAIPSAVIQRGRFHHPNSVSEGFHRGHPPSAYQYPPFPDVLPHPHRPLVPPGLPRHAAHHGHQGPPRHLGHLYPRHSYDSRSPNPRRNLMMADQLAQAVYHPQVGVYGRQGPPPPVDDYAGLMSSQEKQWLATIQMMQLNSNQPYQDDYYFMMFQQRHQVNSGRKFGTHNLKNSRDREAVNIKPSSTYTPLQFENSLGKLQIGSVTAPRKIIDTDLVENVENNSKHGDKKSKQILIEIEEIRNILLQMEDAYAPIFIPSSADPPKEIDLMALQERVMTTLLAEGKLTAFMSIRKGKRAVLRLLPLMFNSAPIIEKLLKELAAITRKDPEQLLLSFLPSIRTYLTTVSLETIVDFTDHYEETFFLSSKFTVSVMANMVERAAQLIDECEDKAVLKRWTGTLLRLVESTKHWYDTERPVVAVERTALLRNLALISDFAKEEHIQALVQALSSLKSTAAKPDLNLQDN